MGHQKVVIFALLLLTIGCNSYKSKIAPLNDTVMPASIDYQFVQQKVFQPYCIRCHSDAGGNDGDVNVETYENVIKSLDLIKKEVLVRQTMPPKKAGGALTAFPQEVLRLWIESGAPRDEKPAPNPEPSPTVSPSPEPSPSPTPILSPTPIVEPVVVLPTWLDITEKIFVPKCLKCHSPGGKAEDTPLDLRGYVVDPQNLLVIAGKPEESGLVHAITRTDNKVMPPPKTGMTLSPQEIGAISTWILNGAQD